MGQRLNIEIKSKNKIVANCYYHWSGYSLSSLKLTKKIIDGFDKVREENAILYAIRLLGLTGAGLTREGFSYLYKNIENFDICEQIPSDNPFSIKYKYPISLSRDEGMIEIEEKYMEENRKWEEGRITIDIDNKTFDFDVLFHISKEDVEKNYSDENWNDSIKLKNILFAEIDFYIEKISRKVECEDYNFTVDGNFYSLIA